MFKQDYYIRASEVFGCSIGVANTITWRTKEESQSDFSVEEFKELDDQIRINRIIQSAIDDQKYQPLMRTVLKLEREMRRGTKPVTIYKLARNGKS